MERTGESNPASDPEPLLDQFEQAWMEGRRPDLDEFYLKAPVDVRRELLLELVRVDLEFCWLRPPSNLDPAIRSQLPLHPRLDDYALAYPELGGIDALPIDMIVEEFRVRILAGDAVTPEDYQRRFPAHDRALAGLLKQTQRQLSAEYSRLRQNTAESEAEISLNELLRRLKSAGLFDETQLQRKNSAANPRSLVQSLVQQRRLTDFQAEMVLAPRGIPLLMGDYLLIDSLGQGGMGAVYKARHRRMQRVVALKVISEECSRSPEIVKRFEREVVAAARLMHPNIVTAFDAGEQDGRPYMIMEYVDGLDLGTIVRRRGPLLLNEALACVIQVARGLAYAHSQGITHRDIKPSNILVERTGVAKILDLGLARLEKLFFADHSQAVPDDMTSTGTVMGTVDYMSPEQASNTRLADARSDIYSLGCTFCFLITGKPMFTGESLIARAMAHRDQPPPSLFSLFPNIDPAMDAIFQRMVAKRPENRFPSSVELLLALEPLHPRGSPVETLLSLRVRDALNASGPIADQRDGGREPQTDTVIPVISPIDRLTPLQSVVGPQNTGFPPVLKNPHRIQDKDTDEIATVTHIESRRDPNVVVNAPPKRMTRPYLVAILMLGIAAIGSLTWMNRDRTNGRSPENPTDAHELLRPFGVTLESLRGPLVLAHSSVTDSDLQLLSRLPELEELVLADTKVSNAGLKNLLSVTHLISLNVENTQVSDGALESIVTLKKLQTLRLAGTGIGDVGINQLESLPNLKELSLSGTKITNRALTVLGRCPNLESLELEQTGIDDVGLTGLTKLTKLRVLNLTSCQNIGDAGMSVLAQCRELENLYLGRTSVGDAGVASLTSLTLKQLWLDHNTAITPSSLDSLAAMTSLKWVSLIGTKYSSADVDRLRQRLPNCQIADP